MKIKAVCQMIGHMWTYGHMRTHAMKKSKSFLKKQVCQIIGHMLTHGHMWKHELKKILKNL